MRRKPLKKMIIKMKNKLSQLKIMDLLNKRITKMP